MRLVLPSLLLRVGGSECGPEERLSKLALGTGSDTSEFAESATQGSFSPQDGQNLNPDCSFEPHCGQ